MRFVSLITVVALTCQPAFSQVLLYDRLAEPHSAAIPNWDGGIAFHTLNRGAQAGQRVSNPLNTPIHQVVGDWETTSFDLSLLDAGVMIQVFAISGDVVGPMLSSMLDSGFASEVTTSGFVRIHSTVGLGLAADNGGGDVLVVMQPQSEDMWGSILSSPTGGAENAFIRDASSFGYPGSWGFTDWRTTGSEGLGASQLNMRVLGVPEPSSFLLTLFSVSLMTCRRKHRSNSMAQ